MVLAVMAAAVLIAWSRHLSFYFDDWPFLLQGRHWTLSSFWTVSSNQHCAAFPMLVFKILLETVGMRSSLPYLAVLVVFHVATAWLLFRLIRRRSGDLPAFWAMGIFLFLARGARDFTWAFQIGFVGSLFWGLLAMVLLARTGRGRPWQGAASVALLLSMMSSGQGVFLSMALGTELIYDRARRGYLKVFILPALVMGAWFATVGMHDRRTGASSLMAGLAYLPTQFPDGVGSALVALGGLPHHVFMPFLVLAAGWLAIHWYRRGVTAQVAGALVGLGALYLAITLTRYMNADPWTSRYVYVGAFYWLFIMGDAVKDLAWRPLLRPVWVTLGVGMVLVNVVGVYYFVAKKNVPFVTMQRVALQTVEALQHAPDANLDVELKEASDQILDAPTLVLPFTPRRYLAETAVLGAPVETVAAAEISRLSAPGVDHAVRLLFGHVLGQVARTPVRLDGTGAWLDSSSRPLDLDLAPNSRVIMRSPMRGQADLYLSWLDVPPSVPTATVSLASQQEVSLRLPDPGIPMRWHLQVRISNGAAEVHSAPR